MKLLLTAFEPFGGEQVNPTMEILAALPDLAGVVTAVLPVTFDGAARTLEELIARERPNAVLMLGQAGGRDRLTVERLAVNLDDASIPDNEGAMPQDAPIQPGAANALFSTLPVKALVQRMREAGVEAAVSDSAGTFVCNHVLYTALWLAQERFPGMRAGFVHVPFLPQQAEGRGKPSMPLPDMARGIEAAVRALLEAEEGDLPPRALEVLRERFGGDALIALSTLDGGAPAVRTVNGHYENGAFYVVTHARSGKMRQIEQNPAVALCGEWFSAQGLGENLGHPRAPGNEAIAARLREAFAAWYGNGHVDEGDPDTCILRVRLTRGTLLRHGTRYELRF